MSTDKPTPNGITRFVELLREGIPTLIEQGTDGNVVQTAHRELLPLTATGDAHFAVYLSDGAAYRIRVQQIGEAEGEEAGCRECGELHAAHELDEHGLCAGCAQTKWSRMSVEERRQWCTVHRVHYPYTDRGPMSPAQHKWVSDPLASHPFRWAKTMSRNPHEYTLRHEWADVGEGTFEEIVRMIREHGYTEFFGGYPRRMLRTNGYKYWTYYSSYVEEVTVLNRKALPLQEQSADQRLPRVN